METYQLSAVIAFLPIIMLFVAYLLFRNGKSGWNRRKDFMFLLGFAALAAYYVYAPDPLHVEMFLEKGDILSPLAYSIVGGAFLVVAVLLFNRHRSE